MTDYKPKLEELLEQVAQESASDLHISAARPPTLRIDGRLVPLMKYGVLSAQDTEGLCLALLDEDQKVYLLKNKEIDLS